MNQSPADEVRPKLLFVCVENSCRSQMAEAFTRVHGSGCVDAFSAGSHPSRSVNPRAIQMMAEVGYDLTAHRSRSLEQIPQGRYEAVVTMGCGDACPHVRTSYRLDWNVPDPTDLPGEEFRAIRDDLERRVVDLLKRTVLVSAS